MCEIKHRRLFKDNRCALQIGSYGNNDFLKIPRPEENY